MKRMTAITLMVGFVAVIFMIVNTGTATAEDGSNSISGTRLRPPHPCTRLRNAITSHDIAEEELEQARDRRTDRYNDWKDEREAFKEFIDLITSEIPDSSWEWGFMPLECFDDIHGDFYVNLGPCMINRLREIAQQRRDAGDNDGAAQAERLLEDLESRYADLESAYQAWNRAITGYDEAVAEEETRRALVAEARRDCDLTRASVSMTDRPWDGLAQKPMSMFDSSLLGQMQDPMGSDANQPSGEIQSAILSGEVEQAQPPQSGVVRVAVPGTNTPAVTPTQARLFNRAPERSIAPAETQTQSTPTTTGQIMQVQQPESTSTGSSTIGYTHMPIPQNAGLSSATAAPAKTPRGMAPLRQMRMQPGHSIKR